MSQFDNFLEEILPSDWSTDGYGLESTLICPHGYRIEMDGECPEGCVSPLKAMGII